MARGFGATLGVGSTDVVTSVYTTGDTLRSYFMWALHNGTGAGGLGRYFDQATGARLFENDGITAGTDAFQHNWTVINGKWEFSHPSAGWHGVGVSYDGGATTNDPIVYVDNTKLTVGSGLTEIDTPNGAFNDGAGNNILVGNRVGDDRNYDGTIAEFAVWNVILTDTEFAALAAGFSPAFIRPASLVEYIPMVRDNVSRKAAPPTIVGTAVQPHTKIIMPRPRLARRNSAAVADTLRAQASL